MSAHSSWIIDHIISEELVDEIDARILDQLIQDARQKTTEIAQKVRVSRPTVYERINKLENEKGIIHEYTTKLNFKKCNLPITAFILVSFDPTKAEGLDQRTVALRISSMKFVRRVNIITGPYDFLVSVAIDDMASLGDMIIDKIRNIEGVGQTQTITSFAEYQFGKTMDRR